MRSLWRRRREPEVVTYVVAKALIWQPEFTGPRRMRLPLEVFSQDPLHDDWPPAPPGAVLSEDPPGFALWAWFWPVEPIKWTAWTERRSK